MASDRKLLIKKFGVLPRGLIDLCSVFKKQGFRGTVEVRAAVAIVFNESFHKFKNVTVSNWSNPVLSINNYSMQRMMRSLR